MNGFKQVLVMGALLAAVSLTGCAGVGVQASVGDNSPQSSGQLEDITLTMDKDSQGG
jgi:hypothetical protein